MFAILFEALLIEIQEEIHHFAGLGRGGVKRRKIVKKKFVNKLAFPNRESQRGGGLQGQEGLRGPEGVCGELSIWGRGGGGLIFSFGAEMSTKKKIERGQTVKNQP